MCQLPSGDIFDTRSISGSNKHAANNRLVGESPSSSPNRGMRSNLEIDFSNQNTAFKNYFSGTNKCLPCSSNNEPIEILSDSSVDDVVVNVKVEDKEKQNGGKRSVDVLVEEMHNRIMHRARRHLSLAIESRMKDDDSVKKKLVKELKRTVRNLEISEENNNHVNAIKSVTESGRRLYEDAIDRLSSEEVLDRVIIFHEED